jgi:ribosomal protein S18 acetylase RimI-like enzyme
MADIRKATPEDAAAVRAVVQAAYQVYIPRIGMKPKPMSADYESLISEGKVWVAVEDRAIVGLVVLVLEPGDLLLENIAVAPAAQGRGVGSQLLRFTEDRARSAGRSSVRLYTNELMVENIAYYTRHQYVETHRDTGTARRAVFFRKSLE